MYEGESGYLLALEQADTAPPGQQAEELAEAKAEFGQQDLAAEELKLELYLVDLIEGYYYLVARQEFS